MESSKFEYLASKQLYHLLMMCYRYTYESWCFVFTWGAILALVVPMGCSYMGHITTWAYVDGIGHQRDNYGC